MKIFLRVLFIVCLVSFLGITIDVIVYGHDGFDKSVISFITQHRMDWLVVVMRSITFFGSGNFLVPAYTLLILVLLFLKRNRQALAVFLISSGGLLVLSQLKLFFHRHRPDLPLISNVATFSYPSGHSFSSVVFFGVLAFIIKEWDLHSHHKKMLLSFILACPFLIGLSRMILNVHYATDVLAGLSLGFVWLVVSHLLLPIPASPSSTFE